MGEGDAMQALYDASYRRLVGQLFAVTGDLAEAEDAVQEAFVRALDRPARALAADNPEAWLRTVALNIARSRFRRSRRLRELLSGQAPLSDVPGLDAEHVDLVAALRQLPAAQREAIALHHVADLPVEQVAATVGCPVGTVKARLSRGRASLAVLLRGDAREEVRDV